VNKALAADCTKDNMIDRMKTVDNTPGLCSEENRFETENTNICTLVAGLTLVFSHFVPTECDSDVHHD
jgi:hypothetical protein